MYSDGDIQAVVLKLNVFMIYSTDEEMAQLISIGGLCEGAVSGYSHLQGGSCGRYFLNAQVLVEGQLPSTSVLRLEKDLAVRIGLRHWCPKHGSAHVNYIHSHRTLST
jgi:hypothetical protein